MKSVGAAGKTPRGDGRSEGRDFAGVPAALAETSAAAERDRLFDALLDQRELLADQVVELVGASIPSYSGVDRHVHRNGALLAVGFALGSIRARGIDGDPDRLNRLISVTRERVGEGVPLEDMVRGWQFGFRVVVERARIIGAELAIDEQIVLDFVDSALLVTERVLEVVHEAHRHGGDPAALETEQARMMFVVAALEGTMPAGELRERASGFGLDVGRPYFAVRARAVGGLVFEELRRALRLGRGQPAVDGLAAELDGDLVALTSIRPTAGVEQLVAGIGPPVSLVELPDSFRLADRALRVAVTFGLVGLYDMRSLGLRPAIADDRDVGVALAARFVDPVISDPTGEDLLDSLRGWFAAGMHVGRAAESLFIHPNTLRYRISRFETLTGANLRDQQTAFEVWWVLEHDQITRGARPAGE